MQNLTNEEYYEGKCTDLFLKEREDMRNWLSKKIRKNIRHFFQFGTLKLRVRLYTCGQKIPFSKI